LNAGKETANNSATANNPETANNSLEKSNINRNNRLNKNNPVTPGPDQNDIVKKHSGQNTTSQTGDEHIYPANQNPSINTGFGDNPESASVALQKSSTGLEVQSGSAQTDAKHLTVPGQPAKSAPVLAIAATPNTDASDYENEPMKDQEYQTDNAISVVALNDPSKGISKFFKKLTKRTPEETNARQVRVSVFQISY
jgi:hypothetical protein